VVIILLERGVSASFTDLVMWRTAVSITPMTKGTKAASAVSQNRKSNPSSAKVKSAMMTIESARWFEDEIMLGKSKYRITYGK
jgi:hypothetical protein